MSAWLDVAVCFVVGALVGGWACWYALRASLRQTIRGQLEAELAKRAKRLDTRAEQIEAIRVEALTERDQAQRNAQQQIDAARAERDQARTEAHDAQQQAADAERRRRNAAGAAERRRRKLTRNQEQRPTAEA